MDFDDKIITIKQKSGIYIGSLWQQKPSILCHWCYEAQVAATDVRFICSKMKAKAAAQNCKFTLCDNVL